MAKADSENVVDLAATRTRRGHALLPAGLLPTKLHLPRARRAVVVRERLLERLDAALDAKLTVVAASAGAGKSSLVTQWAATTEVPLAWVSLDSNDNTVAGCLRYIVASLSSVGVPIPDEADSLLMGGPIDMEAFLTTYLVRPIIACGDVVLVLDDLHLVKSEEVHRVLQWFVTNAPIELHVVVTTRTAPPWKLSKLRLAGDLVEVGQDELRFTVQETESFLRAMRLDVDSALAERVTARTEGWAAAIQLAALAARGDVSRLAEDASRELVSEYLVEEVLDAQTDEVRSFLLHTSVLDRLCGSLCDAVTERDDAARILDELEQSNLLVVPLDLEGQWYRYHHLFGELLLDLAVKEGIDLAANRTAAGAWFGAHDDVRAAASYFAAAQARDRMVDLIETAGESLLFTGDLRTLKTWIASVPGGPVDRPKVHLLSAWAEVLTDGVTDVPDLLQAIDRWVELGRAGDTDALALLEHDLDRYDGNLATLRSYYAQRTHDLPAALERADEALQILPPSDPLRPVIEHNIGYVTALLGDYERSSAAYLNAETGGLRSGNAFVALAAMAQRARVIRLQGARADAQRLATEAIARATEMKLLALGGAGEAKLELAFALYESDDFIATRTALDEAIPRLEVMAGPTLDLMRWVLEGLLAAQAGDEERLRQALGEIMRADSSMTERKPVPFFADLNRLAPLLAAATTAGQRAVLERLAPPQAPQRSVSVEDDVVPDHVVQPLSERELEVLGMLAEGLSNKEIAERSFVTVGTVKTHVHHILQKLDVKNRTQAVHRARSLGILVTVS